MICAHPVETSNGPVSCGRCQNCRVNHKRMWTGRIVLEASEYKTRSTFSTLTYSPEYLPPGGGLRKSHVQNFLQSLRDAKIGKIRYFAVGEYGEKTQRPHYHLALFGLDPFVYDEEITRRWKYGHVKNGEITSASAAYCAGYCTKKLDEKEVLAGQPAEFHMASKAPPLGAAGVKRIEQTMYTRHGAKMLEKLEDVPNSFRLEGKVYPLGKYWTNYLRDQVFQGEFKPVGMPKMYWEVNVDAETKAANEALRAERQQLARQHHAKAWRRRNANSRTL